MKRKIARGKKMEKEDFRTGMASAAGAVPAFPSDEAIQGWTMRNNSPLFDDEKALGWYRRYEAEFNADADEFLLTFKPS